MTYEYLFLKSLFLTILIETTLLILLFWFVFRNEEFKISRLLMTGFFTSFATLPYLWFIFPNYIEQNFWYMTISESFAVIMESFIIAAMLRIKYFKSLICSVICNMGSFSIGLLIHWP